MQSEPDPAADAGLGAQALLGLSKVRDDVEQSRNIPSLSAAPPTRAQDALALLGVTPTPPTAAAASAHANNPSATAPLHQHTRPTVLDTSSLLVSRSRAQSGSGPGYPHPRTLDDATSPVTTAIPRLPPMSTAEGRTHGVPLHFQQQQGTNLPEAHRPDIPRLQSISELAPSRSPQLPRPATTELPKFSSLPSMQGLPHSLPPLPQHHSNTRQSGLWGTTSTVPGFHASYHPLPATTLPNYGSMATPPMLSMPVHHAHHAAPELHQRYYPQAPPPPSQYSGAPSTIPQLVPPQTNTSRMAPSSFAGSTSFLPPPRLPGLAPPPSFQTQHAPPSSLRTDILPPIINGATKAMGLGELRNIPTCGDTAVEQNRGDTGPNANGMVSADQLRSHPVSSKIASSYPPPSRGRIADLMNPTENVNVHPAVTLVTLASQSEPLPVENARIESPSLSRVRTPEKVAMARDLFGSGDDVVLCRNESAEPQDMKVAASMTKSAKPTQDVNGRNHVIGRDSPIWKTSATRKSALKEKRTGSSAVKRRDSACSADDVKRYESDDGTRGEGEKDSSSDTENGAEESDVTRCPCGTTANIGTMIACDECNTWQHRICMGFRRQSDVPNKYFCHICRPQEVRINCVAHPKFRERMMQKDPDHRYEPILSSVKPIELRKKFSAELVAKREGNHDCDFDAMFTFYASLYRTHFTKDRQSMVDGLIVLTELPREVVQPRFDAAIKKSKESIEKMEHANGDRDRRERRKDGNSNQHGKRSRPLSSNYELLSGSHELAKAQIKRASPEKELTAAEKKELSREERKNRQVLSLFARLEERDKKKPRLGEPSGSPRTTSVSSPKEVRGHSSKQPSAPSETVNLSPSIAHDGPSYDKRDVISVDVSKTTLASALAGQGKRDRGSKDRKESRRREQREGRKDGGAASSADMGKRSGLPRKRERQILGSGSRKRGKSEMKTSLADLEPKLLYSVRLPGPSVIGSQVVPRNRRSSLDNQASVEAEGNKSIISARQSTKKGRYQIAAERAETARNRAKKHAIRKRMTEQFIFEQKIQKKQEMEKQDETMNETSKVKTYSCPEELHGIDEATHLAIARNFASKKRVLGRTGHSSQGKGVEKVCFKKRLIRSGPTKLSIRQLPAELEASSRVSAEAGAQAKAPGALKTSSSPSAEHSSEPQSSKPNCAKPLPLALRATTSKNKQTLSPPCRPPPLRSSPLTLNVNRTPKLSSDGVSITTRFLASSPIPARTPTPPMRSRSNSASGHRIAPPLRSSAPSPPASRNAPLLRSSIPSPPAGRSAPPLRSSAPSPPASRLAPPLRSSAPSPIVVRKSPPLRISAPSPPTSKPAPPQRSCVPSPPPAISRTPPPLRSAACPRLPFRSKPLGTVDRKNTHASRGSDINSDVGRSAVNGHGTDKRNEEKPNAVSAQQILNSRLESLLKSKAGEVQTPSPRVPKPIPRLHHPHPRHPRALPNSLNPSPRVSGPGLGPKYNTGGVSSGPRRSGDGLGPSKRPMINSMGPRLGGKGKPDNRMRNGLTNGKQNSGTDTTPWERYRQQNGWNAIYANPSAGSSQDGKNSGSQRRRPPY